MRIPHPAVFAAGVAAAVAAASACLPPDQGGSGAAEVVQAFTLPPQCDQDDCGNGNSPVIDGVYFWHLHSLGLPNSRGVAIQRVTRSDGAAMQLVAVNDQLFGRDSSNAIIAAGAGLVGTKIRVTVPIDGVRKPYQIRIVNVTPTFDDSVRFWVGDQARVEAYVFHYAPVLDPISGRVGDERPLCSLANSDPRDPMIEAIAFTGDTYDPYTKEITLGAATDGWMNIACKNSAPYKMHLVGYTTPAAARLGIVTSLDERRAMLNAWTMNACGTGRPFTTQGVPLRLTESRFWLPASSPYQPDVAPHEAIWGPGGAACLDVHRSGMPKTEIEDACGRELPACSTTMVASWTTVGHVLTAPEP